MGNDFENEVGNDFENEVGGVGQHLNVDGMRAVMKGRVGGWSKTLSITYFFFENVCIYTYSFIYS